MLCEFCRSRTGSIEIEVMNMTAGDVFTCLVCTLCAHAAGTSICCDSDGIMYSNLGCIGGAPEEVN